MTFPKMEGAINGISLIGSVADRHAHAKKMTITNCYYLEGSADIDFSNALITKGDKATKSLADVYGGKAPDATQRDARERMLQGNLQDMRSVMWGEVNQVIIYAIDLKKLTYAQMSGKENLIETENGSAAAYKTFLEALNQNGGRAFSWVTNEENGSTIHGKYSFPGGDTALQGQDYPFPTVLTQTNSLGKPVNLHYGAWPKVGMFWSKGIVSLDLIADYDKAVTGKSAIKLNLNLSNIPFTPTGELKFTYSDEGSENQVVKVAESKELKTADDKLVGFEVTLEGLHSGASEVTATFGDYTARLMVTVTDKLTVVLEPASVELTLNPPTPPTGGPSKSATVTPTLVDKNGKVLTVTSWEAVSAKTDVATCEVKTNNTITVTGLKQDETRISITATYKLNGKEYTPTTLLPVTVKEISGGG